jgi:lipopolysaccharide/colanic/teichoic acid biosynthesis glycosyltransferase
MEMGTGSPASSVTDFGGRPHRSAFLADGGSISSADEEATREAVVGRREDMLSRERPRTLAAYDFLQQLRSEKRRADRTQRPLSLVLFRTEQWMVRAGQPSAVFETLHRCIRETDILGHMTDDSIAVLCPDTDREGLEGFLRKVRGHSELLSTDCSAATYPDHLFESLQFGESRAPQVHSLVRDAEEAHEYGFKRCIDLVGAIVALIVFSPVMLAIAIAIRTTSRGPVIFRQVRLGKGGAPFVFYKFRSMVADGDDCIHQHYVEKLIRGKHEELRDNRSSEPFYKMRADPRITRVGRIIRNTSLDELPQLFNVLKGNMSLVGPRPPIPYEAMNYQPWHLRRVMGLKPGITGLWQTDGRSRVTFDEMVRMDLRYIRECCFTLDLKILLKTVLVVIRCDGAT